MNIKIQILFPLVLLSVVLAGAGEKEESMFEKREKAVTQSMSYVRELYQKEAEVFAEKKLAKIEMISKLKGVDEYFQKKSEVQNHFKKGGSVIVYYFAPTEVTLGGDLSILCKYETGEILDYIRGR